MSRRRRPKKGGRNRPRKKSGKLKNFAGKVFSNRRNPRSSAVTGDDIVSNLREWWYTFINRVPGGGKIYWKNGKIVGHSSRNKW